MKLAVRAGGEIRISKSFKYFEYCPQTWSIMKSDKQEKVLSEFLNSDGCKKDKSEKNLTALLKKNSLQKS
jgi:hypothetical protein